MRDLSGVMLLTESHLMNFNSFSECKKAKDGSLDTVWYFIQGGFISLFTLLLTSGQLLFRWFSNWLLCRVIIGGHNQYVYINDGSPVYNLWTSRRINNCLSQHWQTLTSWSAAVLFFLSFISVLATQILWEYVETKTAVKKDTLEVFI